MRVSPKIVFVHPINHQIRGRVSNKAALVDSMETEGQQNEIVCVPGSNGTYLAIDGGSRLSALKEMGVEMIEIIVRPEMTEDEVRRYILSTAVRFPFPELILEDGHPVGGMCVAIVQELATRPKIDVCRAYNMAPDLVSAYKYLYTDTPDMQEAVASGRLSMTVYSRIKRKPRAFKEELVAADGNISYKKVQEKKRQEKERERVENGQVYTYESIPAAVSVRDMVWEMSAHPIQAEAREFLLEARQLIDQLLGGEE